jgi:hypothetical protein
VNVDPASSTSFRAGGPPARLCSTRLAPGETILSDATRDIPVVRAVLFSEPAAGGAGSPGELVPPVAGHVPSASSPAAGDFAQSLDDETIADLLERAKRFAVGIKGLRGQGDRGESNVAEFVRRRWLGLPFGVMHRFVDEATSVPISRWVKAAAAMDDDQRYRFYSALLIIETTRRLRKRRGRPLLRDDARMFGGMVHRLWAGTTAREKIESDFAAMYELRGAISSQRYVARRAKLRRERQADIARRVLAECRRILPPSGGSA